MLFMLRIRMRDNRVVDVPEHNVSYVFKVEFYMIWNKEVPFFQCLVYI